MTRSDPSVAEGPVRDYRTAVLDAWIDENDHMDTLYYKVVADGGCRALFQRAGLDRELLAATGGTLFQLEMHVCFERELRRDDPLVVQSWLVAADAKRIHHFHEIIHETAGYRAASVELMTLHVSRATRRAAPMPPQIVAKLEALAAAHAKLPQPAKIGKGVGMRRPD